MVWYGMVWYGMVWYGMVWDGMGWDGMVSLPPAQTQKLPPTKYGPHLSHLLEFKKLPTTKSTSSQLPHYIIPWSMSSPTYRFITSEWHSYHPYELSHPTSLPTYLASPVSYLFKNCDRVSIQYRISQGHVWSMDNTFSCLNVGKGLLWGYEVCVTQFWQHFIVQSQGDLRTC